MKQQQILVKCTGEGLIDFHKLQPLQGELKSLSVENYERLKHVILTLGFSSPFHVWFSPKGSFILDGTQRHRALRTMEDEGFEIPALPYVSVEASSEKEARRKLIALASQYGKVEGQGLYEFMTESEIDMNELMLSASFPDLNIQHFAAEFFDGWSTDLNSGKVDNVEANLDGILSVIKIVCPQEKRDEIVEFLRMNIIKGDVQLE